MKYPVLGPLEAPDDAGRPALVGIGTPPSGTVTLLFSDIQGSTRLWEEAPEAMADALRRHDVLLHSAIGGSGGHVFKTVGDAFCAAFRTAKEAVRAAEAAQRGLYAETWPEGICLRVRMALHTGECEERDGDYFGPAVNRVARLQSIAHGGQVLLTRATADMVRDWLPPGVQLRSLGMQRLKDIARPEEVFQLELAGLDAGFPPLASPAAEVATNLPEAVSSFVGRDWEMAEIRSLMAASRLVTLTGAGGSGKTRLALQVAAEALDRLTDGVWLVELGPLAESELVDSTVASALGVREELGRPVLETLAGVLSGRSLLLVLDNCEHLLAASAKLVDTLLRSCPRLRMLATSREPLGVDGEQLYRVPSLSMPDPGRTLVPAEARSFDAVGLFVERARARQSDFRLDVHNADTVASLCRALDGMPLAIELAAARVTSLSVADINRRLGDRFALLTRGRGSALLRHQTLRTLIDWSYDLLDDRERVVLCRLSVFSAGWTLVAAEAVCSRGGVEPPEVADLLSSLVDKSLVQAEAASGGLRYRLLETIRHYVTGKLSELEEGEEASTRWSHACFFLVLAEEAAPHLCGGEQARWFDHIETELGNLRAAMAYFTSDPSTIHQALRIGIALRDFWFCGFLSQGIEALEATLPDTDDEGLSGLRSAAALSAAYLHFEQGAYAAARIRFEEAMKAGQTIGQPGLMAEALGGLSLLALRQGDRRGALDMAEESCAFAAASGDRFVVADALNHRGAAKSACGDPSDQADFEEALAGFREVDNRFGVTRVLQSLAIRALKDGSLEAARSHINESLDLGREMTKDGRAMHASIQLLGLVELLDGNIPAAHDAYAELLLVANRLGTRPFVAYALLGLGFCASATGDFHRSAILHGAADALFERLGEALDTSLLALRSRDHRQLRRTMGERAFDSDHRTGAQLAPGGAIALALEDSVRGAR